MFALLVVLIGGISWLVWSVHGLSGTANNVGALTRSDWATSRPAPLFDRGDLMTQADWGRRVMTAVALIAFTLMMLFINLIWHDPRKEPR